ncbi:MAG: hypothetical protein ACE5G2_03755 [Candidatus Krumholzibacteriia bacterium]
MHTRSLRARGWILAVIAILAMLGCSREEPAESEETVTGEATISADVASILARADQLDGTADKVLSKCAGCGFAMDGSPEHAVKVGEYEMHLCSEKCKASFAEDASKSVLALEIPES